MEDPEIDTHAGTIAEAETESRLRLLIDTGLLLASERSLDIIVQAALDAGLKLSGAAFGAFFYNTLGPDRESYQPFKLSGIDPGRFSGLPMPPPTAIFGPPFRGEGVIRSEDITRDPRYGHNAPFQDTPDGHIAVRSYLAVPVRSRGGEVLGGLFYGHPQPGIFQHDAEALVGTVAAQTAVAVENSRLTESLTREVAEAEAARAALRSTTRRLRQALDAAHMGTWSWNSQTGMIDFDERGAALFGVEPGIPVSRDRLRNQVVHREDMASTPEDLRELLRSGGQYAAEYRVRTPEGGQRWVGVHGNAAFSEATGEILGMIGTLQDVTARKMQEETLRTSEKLAATGRLAATIAHEINNPLEAVMNLIYLAKTDPAAPTSVSSLLDTADGELARVSQIAQQTLGFYRDTTRPVTIDLNELLNTVVDLFGRKLNGKRLRCTLDLEPGLSIVALQGEIRQVISNLLVNAIEASPATGASIRIRARHRRRDGRKGVSVLIADQGSGIPAPVGERLFAPFVTTKQSTGTGLGLWVTRGMVEKHGGSVAFRSTVKSPSGTVFRVYLPESASPSLFASQITPTLQ